MADAPLVTIIVPNYNYGRFLDECLSSAVGQTYEHLQVIFIDNSSSDDSYEIALRFRARYGDRILVYRNDESLGGSRNCDKANRLMSADSEFHIYLSSDDAFTGPVNMGATFECSMLELAEMVIRATGSYPDFSGVYTARIDGSGRLTVDYRFEFSGAQALPVQ